jgi:hypothetical protein
MKPEEEMAMSRMRAVRSLVAGSLAVGSSMTLASEVLAQQAVQWRVEDGGNGHWYEARSITPLPPTRALQEAAASAIGGSMLVVDSELENQFALALVSNIGAGESFGIWIGLYRANPGTSWIWSNGLPLVWSAWGGGDCAFGPYPNDEGNGGELGTMIYRQNCGIVWDDTPTAWISDPPSWWVASTNMRLFIEYSADCNNDGIVDYGQILAGELKDANSNGVPDCCDAGVNCDPCPGDVTRNGSIDGIDLAAVLAAWGGGKSQYDCDIDDDGIVGGSDLAAVLAGWGACP